MSLNVTFNGSMYIIPETGEVGWGGNTTSYLVAIAAGALQKTGGSFTLSSEIDFGASFGVKSLYYKSRSANIAAAGILRLNNNSDSINWRNAANNADLPLTVDASDRLLYNGVLVLTGTSPSAYVSSITGTANQVIASSPTGAVTLSLPQSINSSANVQFGTLGLGSSIVPSSILSLTSTSLGFLPPRVTTIERDAIAAPATGLFVYNTTTGVYNFYNGSVWTAIAAGGTINPGVSGFFSYYPVSGSTLDDQTVMSTNGTTQVYFIDGSVAVPSISFASDTDTGFRRQASGIVDYISNGAVLATLATNSFQVTGGTAAIPGLTFIVDSDTGIYRTAANSLGVTLGGVKNLDMTSSVSTIQSSFTFGTARVSGFSATPTTGGTVPANTYYYKVFALNANGYIGIPSNELVVVVGGPNNKVDLSWSTVTDAVSYRIQRGTDQGGGAGYWVTAGITFSDSGQAFDFPGQGAVQAVNQFKVELPGTVDFTASQGGVRWRGYVDSSIVEGSIACTSAGEMEFVTTSGVVAGMFLFSKYGTASPFNIDLRFTNPRVAFNSAQGEIACGGVVGANFFAAGTPTGMQTPNGLGISDGSVSLPGLYFINDTNTGFYRANPDQILVTLGGVQSTIFDAGVIQGLVRTAASPTFSWIADPDSGMYNVAGNQIGFSTGGTLRFDISTTAVTSTLPLLAPNGSAAAPSHSFSTDTDTGMFRANANEIQFAAGGTTTFQIETNDVQIISGTAAIPAYSFISDPDTGIYVAAANDLGFSTGGTLRLDISTTNVTSTLPFLAPNGTAGAPSHSFANDTDTGMFRANANEIQFAAGGTTTFQIETNDVQIIDGTVSIPAYSFINDADCGMYRIGTNSIGLATNGVRALAINSSQAVAIKGTSTNDNATAGDVGEYLSAVNTAGTNAPTTNTFGDAASLSLTAGDWDVSLLITWDQNGATWTRADAGISTTSGNSGTGLNTGENFASNIYASSSTTPVLYTLNVPVYRVSLSATTTYYAKVRAIYSAGQPQYYYRFSARRVR